MARELPSVIDSVLLTLVQAINFSSSDDEQGLGLVLVVDGATVAGRLIPNWLWFKKVAENIRTTARAQDDEQNVWANTFSEFGDQMVSYREDAKKIAHVLDELPEDAQRVVINNDPTAFIHLEDARVYTPGFPGIPDNGMLWRGRLHDVSGWSFGLFESPR